MTLKFRKEKISHLLGHTEVQFTEESTRETSAPFKICAHAGGVYFMGVSPVLRDVTDYDSFAKAVGDASKEHMQLKPRIVSPDDGGAA